MSSKIGRWFFSLILIPFISIVFHSTAKAQDNYLQDGNSTSTSLFTLNVDTDYIYLNGEQVDNYIKEERTRTVYCLVALFEKDNNKQLLVIVAKPQSFTNVEENSRKYSYLLSPGMMEDNRSHCDTADLSAALYSRYPGSSIVFLHENICPRCSSSFLQSEPLALFDTAGDEVNQADVDISKLKIKLNLVSSANEPANSCDSTPQCRVSGYDCCNNGACIRDGAAKLGAENLPGFSEAQEKIEQNLALVSDYPQYFHACGHIVNRDAADTDFNAEDDALKRFQKRKELYECLTPRKGEESICTINYTDATKTPRTFTTGIDDRNFTDTYSGEQDISSHSIEEIVHDKTVLFGNGSGEELIGVGNDTLHDPTVITLPANRTARVDDTLKIRYRVDGSCQSINTALAYCSKHYIQGQNLGEVDDHYPASLRFSLPYYADTDRAMQVTVDEINKIQNSDWQLVESLPSYVEFTNPREVIHDDQKVVISFFVDLILYPVMHSLEIAKNEVNESCNCGDSRCSLKPITKRIGGKDVVATYECDYFREDSDVETPPQVYLSSKTVPVRYFDELGKYHQSIDINTPKQEGNFFTYIRNNYLRPNNVDEYVGFNEIYGSIINHPVSARPAKEIPVKKGLYYNIYVNDGNFSTCAYCGSDYYSKLARVFPYNFSFQGGGYNPFVDHNDPVRTNPYRAHDLIFGRACFVPATMIPWTHSPDSDQRGQQRINRMRAQHFLFANGYQRDWYGFDYGSLIGSFDGVSWFSIGNRRQIRALSSKLFLAFNAYFGDLTDDNTYSIHIIEATLNRQAGQIPQRDFDSDGATCQRLHQCENDSDCASNLGWEYTCEDIKNIRSKWPLFDANATEKINLERNDRLAGIFNYGFGGTNKRCVYRGRGAPCHIRMTVGRENSYAQVERNSLHACSMNNYCQSFIDGELQPKFNDKINRFARSVANQNLSSLVARSDADLFGMTAPIIGRPYDYNGGGVIDATTQSVLADNNISAICIPGRDPTIDTDFVQHNSLVPQDDFYGDPV
ncbi:MAG: hypothetical protein OXB84_01815, partial [Halobacteriovoraceae bacterium]|nr:hypothetical protein [Halobacteriovoraceae bacterium]